MLAKCAWSREETVSKIEALDKLSEFCSREFGSIEEKLRLVEQKVRLAIEDAPDGLE